MKLALALFSLVAVLGMAACGPSEAERKRARLERELRQEKALEQMAHSAPLEVRAGMFDTAIAEEEKARQKQLLELQEQIGDQKDK